MTRNVSASGYTNSVVSSLNHSLIIISSLSFCNFKGFFKCPFFKLKKIFAYFTITFFALSLGSTADATYLPQNFDPNSSLAEYPIQLKKSIESIAVSDYANVKVSGMVHSSQNKGNEPSPSDTPTIQDRANIHLSLIIPAPDVSQFAIPERIFERDRIPKSPISKTFSSLYLQNHQTENPIENNIKIEAATPILDSINSVNSFDVTISQSVDIISAVSYDFPPISPDIINIQTEDWNNFLAALILVPVAGLAVRNYENKKNLSSSFWRVIPSFVIIILISSIIITPFSISSSYWGFAYGEKPTEFDESVSVSPGSDTKVKGKPADNESKGKPADNESKGKPADNESKGKPADNESKGKPA